MSNMREQRLGGWSPLRFFHVTISCAAETEAVCFPRLNKTLKHQNMNSHATATLLTTKQPLQHAAHTWNMWVSNTVID